MIWRRIAFSVLAILLAAAAGIAVPASRAPILQCVASVLVVDESAVAEADVIVVAVDAGSAGLLEAAELLKSGAAPRVAVFSSPPGKVASELRARGLPFQDAADLHDRQLQALEVRSVIETPRVAGTAEQGEVLAEWCGLHGFRSVLIVTSWHHSRRVERIVQRSLVGHPVTISVHVTSYSDFAPFDWWKTRAGLRTVITELQKLALDFCRHPFS